MATEVPAQGDAAESGIAENIPCDEEQATNGTKYAEVEDASSKFSKMFAVDPTEQLAELEALVDNLLTYSGECCSVTDQIRGESNKLLFIALPQFYEKRAAMNKIFKQIDALEEFVTTIKENVDEMELSVQLAEKQLGNKNLKRIISSIPIPSFFSQKKPVQSVTKADAKEIEPQIPESFKTDNFIYSEEICLDNSRDSPIVDNVET